MGFFGISAKTPRARFLSKAFDEGGFTANGGRGCLAVEANL